MNATATLGLITSAITTFGGAALVILAALLVLAVGLLVFRWGWIRLRNAAGENMPGTVGYDSTRGSGASAGNVARMESQGSSGKKINLLG